MLKLYYAPGTCALASHIALIDAGAAFEAVRIDFTKQQQQSPDYLTINPKGRVPALVTAQGVITETPAILATADRSVEVRDAARAANVDIIHKPLKPAPLRALLARCLALRAAAE